MGLPLPRRRRAVPRAEVAMARWRSVPPEGRQQVEERMSLDAIMMYTPHPPEEHLAGCPDCHGRGWFQVSTNDGDYDEAYCRCEASKWARSASGDSVFYSEPIEWDFWCTDCGHREKTWEMFNVCPACRRSGWNLNHAGPVVEWAAAQERPAT